MNRVTLAGRLLYPPRVRQTQTGTIMASILIAVPRCRGGTAEDYIRITAWDAVAIDLRDLAAKDDYLLIDGVVHTRAIENNGGKDYVQEIIAITVDFPGRKPPQKVDG